MVRLFLGNKTLKSRPPIADLPGAAGGGGGLPLPGGQRGRGDLALRQHPRDLRLPAEVPRRPRGGRRRRAKLPPARHAGAVQGGCMMHKATK